jgi:hypothetical protein
MIPAAPISTPTMFAGAMRSLSAYNVGVLCIRRGSLFPNMDSCNTTYQSHLGMSWSEQPSNELDRVRGARPQIHQPTTISQVITNIATKPAPKDAVRGKRAARRHRGFAVSPSCWNILRGMPLFETNTEDKDNFRPRTKRPQMVGRGHQEQRCSRSRKRCL